MLLFMGCAAGTASAAGEVFWVADTAAGAIYRFDPHLRLLSTTKGLPSPRALADDARGGAWVACGDAALGTRIAHVSRAGRARWAPSPFALVPDIATASDGGAWVADRGTGSLVRLDSSGERRLENPFPGIACVEVIGPRVAVGTTAGEISCFDESLVLLAKAAVGGQIVDLREGPGGDLWALDAAAPGRVLRLGPDLDVRGAAILGFPAEHLAAADGGVWVAATNAPLLRHYCPHVQMDLQLFLTGEGDPNFLESAPEDGSAILPIGSTVIRVGIDGTILAEAAGFGSLSGVARGKCSG